MVTGVETAGLVLGAFPLVVSGIQAYRNGLKPLRIWWRYRTKILEFSETVGVQHIIFENNVELLLDPVVTSNEQMASLLMCPGGDEWKTPGLTKNLKERLSKNYDQYMATLVNMNETLHTLQKNLGIVDGKVIALTSNMF